MGVKKEFNKYKIIDDITIIYLEKRSGEIFECLIDTEDLERIKSLNVHWHAAWDEDIQDYYCKSCEYLGIFNGKPKYKIRYIHREIMKATKGTYVDHIEHKKHSKLDNRKRNLRVTKATNNSTNRKGANKNSGTGVRNVNYGGNNKSEYWVQFCKEGERYKWVFPLDHFKEACEFAEKKRQELYGKYSGKS